MGVRITRELKRWDVWKKYNKHCAYCGKAITYIQLQVDHIHSQYHDGNDHIDNLNPACARCNRWKKTFNIEEFRNEIQMQLERLKLRSAPYRLAMDYGIIKKTKNPVKFHFELTEKI